MRRIVENKRLSPGVLASSVNRLNTRKFQNEAAADTEPGTASGQRREFST